MPRSIYVNGQYKPYHQAAVHVEDRGYQFGDAVYEVVASIHGHLADERGHLDRLERSLKELRIPMPVSREVLRVLMRECMRRNKLTNAGIYIQVSRGVARRDFKFPKANTKPALVIIAFPIDFDGHMRALAKNGISVKTLPDIRWTRRDIKTVLLLPQSMTKQIALDDNYDEAWMIDGDGYVTEGTSNNAWILNDKNELQTRPVSHEILNGITRTVISRICAENNIKLVEKAFTPAEAYKAKEAFVSSANTIATAVNNIDGHKIGNGKAGPITTKIYNEYRAYVEGLRGEQVHWGAGL